MWWKVVKMCMCKEDLMISNKIKIIFVFSELFKALLQQSKEGFHQMFKQTYGVIYEQNSYVFSELFVMLEGYFLRGKLDLNEMMDKFFNQLYQKMFTVINRQYDFNDE